MLWFPTSQRLWLRSTARRLIHQLQLQSGAPKTSRANNSSGTTANHPESMETEETRTNEVKEQRRVKEKNTESERDWNRDRVREWERAVHTCYFFYSEHLSSAITTFVEKNVSDAHLFKASSPILKRYKSTHSQCTCLPIVPGGHGCLATAPWRVFGQVRPDSLIGLQYSTAILGKTDEGSEREVTSERASPTDGCSVVELRVIAAVVAGDLVVAVVVEVVGVVMVTVTGRVVVRIVVVSIKTFPEEDDSEIKNKWQWNTHQQVWNDIYSNLQEYTNTQMSGGEDSGINWADH